MRFPESKADPEDVRRALASATVTPLSVRWVPVPVIHPQKDGTCTTSDVMIRVTVAVHVAVMPALTARFREAAEQGDEFAATLLKGKPRTTFWYGGEIYNSTLEPHEVVELIG